MRRQKSGHGVVCVLSSTELCKQVRHADKQNEVDATSIYIQKTGASSLPTNKNVIPEP